MKKITFLLLALIVLANVHAQQPKQDISSKTVKAVPEKKLNVQLSPAKISKPAHNGGDEKMLNPQPLPPKENKDFKAAKQGSEKMLNPQPLPPKEIKPFKAEKKGSEKMLNPQPLPPKESSLKIKN